MRVCAVRPESGSGVTSGDAQYTVIDVGGDGVPGVEAAGHARLVIAVYALVGRGGQVPGP